MDDLIKDLAFKGYSWGDIALEVGLKREQVRYKARNSDWYHDYQQWKSNGIPEKAEVKEKQVMSRSSDGSITISIKDLVFMEKQALTDDRLLELVKLDPSSFKVKNAVVNHYSMTNSDGEEYWNYQIKVSAAPIVKEVSVQNVLNALDTIEPRRIELLTDEVPKEYLLIPLSDLHLQFNEYDDLQKRLADVILESYEEIVFAIMGDYFHVDNFLNTTEHGTRVDDVDFEKGIQYGFHFLIPLLELALENSPSVKLVYLPGNHSPSIDYMFIQAIKRLYPDVIVDDSVTQYKHTWLGGHSIFLHHGDQVKNPKRLHEIITSMYAKEWGESSSRYLITGHFHHEKSLSFGGLTHYQVQAPTRLSSYDERKGYIDSEEGQMVFVFDKDKRRIIYYV